MELLKQPLYQPKSDAEQVVLLTLAAHGVLDVKPSNCAENLRHLCVSSARTRPA